MRNIICTWLRKGEEVRTHSFTKTDNAIARMTRHILDKGEPGDVIEITHRLTELYIGAMKVRLGKIGIEWAWDDLPQLKTH